MSYMVGDIVKKIISFSLMLVALVCSYGFASSNVAEDSSCKDDKKHKEIYVNIYAKNSNDAEVVSKLLPKSDTNYTVFYCTENSWCEIVNQENGNTGWINMEELKKAEEAYMKQNQKKIMFQKMISHMHSQDKRIEQLEIQIVNMQKELVSILQAQQQQINRLSQGRY
ncbi:bacterial SH3 domain protein [Francisella frigiditurris]|uniref:Bacterial SH3 domain protein n=1 Tax=Francisella frigiditurris TaxID=1542390 RepID=A0A1J0KU92_9GAMM|nr:bacterial SH3 domain protein [Francisella frigiditurris]